METSNLDQEELNRRAGEVFDLRIGDYVYDVCVEDDGTVRIPMRELSDSDDDWVDFDYLPDMKDRQEALEYLMGKRDDFND
jgi:hypothetical protein